MNPHELFLSEVEANITSLGQDADLQALSRIWARQVVPHKWAYNFSWLGRPAIQFPNDAWALQELISATRPDLIIETGIAHGGSLIFSASMLALLDLCDASQSGELLDPKKPRRKVLGIDIDIRPHNRQAIKAHPLASRIEMIEGSSIDASIIAKVQAIAQNHARVMVCLDSNHTHDHVLTELCAYAPLVTPGLYCVVFDTLIDDMPQSLFTERSWGPGNSPKSAVRAFVKENPDFQSDVRIDHKLLISVAPEGFLKRSAV